MKTQLFPKVSGCWVMAVALALLQPAFAGTSAQTDLFKKQLKAAKAAELPAAACKLVAQVKPEERESAAEAVVAATHAVRPVALVAVVGALAREFPAVAPAAAAKAATLKPKDAGIIARAAAAAAPGRAVKIAQAVAKAAPSEYAAVAAGVAQGAPEASKEDIWAAISTVVPSLRNATASASSAASVAALPPPTVGPPFTGIAPGPGEMNRTNTVEIPPGGGRFYSGP
ncbi:MAG: hypothetical protein RMK20_07155 [Verrucomicrobiales bacterium]|nr:hypothetical protein [Verrucomicrobiales bacterium]